MDEGCGFLSPTAIRCGKYPYMEKKINGNRRNSSKPLEKHGKI
jgi:hypothetical protein